MHRDVVDLDPALSQQLLGVAKGQPEAQNERTARVMTSGGNRKPAKAELSTGGDWRERRRAMPSLWSTVTGEHVRPAQHARSDTLDCARVLTRPVRSGAHTRPSDIPGPDAPVCDRVAKSARRAHPAG